MTEYRDDPRLVVGRNRRDAIAKAMAYDVGVVGEAQRGVASRPSAAVLQRLRQVPVVQREVRRDAAREQPVDEPIVKVEPARIDRAGAARLHARPRDREAIPLQAQLAHQIEVCGQAVIVVASDITVAAVGDRAGHAAEAVPDRRSATVLGHGTFDLVRARRSAPHERRGLNCGSVSRHRSLVLDRLSRCLRSLARCAH